MKILLLSLVFSIAVIFGGCSNEQQDTYGNSEEKNRDLETEYNRCVERYKEKFNIDVKLAQDDKDSIYSIERGNIAESTIDALKNMEVTLEKLPKNFVSMLDVRIDSVPLKSGLVLYLSEEIKENDKISAGVTTLNSGANYAIIINYNTNNDLRITIAHELFHVMTEQIQLKANYANGDMYSKYEWSLYNPDGFEYAGDLWLDSEYTYTAFENKVENMYFLTPYAKKSVLEDMAETFGYMMLDEKDVKRVFESEHIQAKAKYISQMLETNFGDVGEDPFWNRMVKDDLLEGEYVVEVAKKESAENSYWEINISNIRMGFNQQVIVKKDADVALLPNENDMIIQKDVNFDGYKDVLIHKGDYGSHKEKLYEAYLWNERLKSFVKSESFSDIFNPKIRPDEKQIVGKKHNDDGTYTHFVYEFKNNRYVCVNEVTSSV